MFAAGLARRKGISMLLCRRMQPADLPRATALAAAGSINLTPLISERFPLHEASQAFAALAARGGLKVVVTPQPGLV
jgi:threonine dehydrogenase-like Zn-dependent dehydrogenase